MSIQWFPGHMTAAYEAASKGMGRTDVVIEVLDARAPGASYNPALEPLRRQAQRPALKVLNKADLADPERTKQWLRHYNAQPRTRAIAISSKATGEAGRVPKECMLLAPGRGTIAKPLRLMILGVPNVGKSTLMNTLSRRHLARVGDEPGVTKTPMRHELRAGLVLVDTAGLLWPRMTEDVALKLAALHSVGAAAYDPESVAASLGDILLRDYRQALLERYGVAGEPQDGHDLLVHVARARSFLVKGGEADLRKAAVTLLTDFRSGALGAVTLELPPAAPEELV
jgi:ribosome biogenesis GTPase A